MTNNTEKLKLSQKITNRRTDRLDEWSMDELSRDVSKLESEIAELTKERDELKASEWISVEDRLPEDGCPVAVRLERMNGSIEYSTCVYIGFFPFKSICWESGVSKEPVTHWAPLPKEPKE